MKSLLLDVPTWDLKLDSSGNIAAASGAYAVAQDVACALRLFAGELWYDTAQGVPYFETILGFLPSRGFLMAKFSEAALGVPGVVSVVVSLDDISVARNLTGSVVCTLESGEEVEVEIGVPWYTSAVSPS